MKIQCPSCGMKYDVDDNSAGRKAQCCRCGERFVLPLLDSTSEEKLSNPEIKHPPISIPGIFLMIVGGIIDISGIFILFTDLKKAAIPALFLFIMGTIIVGVGYLLIVIRDKYYPNWYNTENHKPKSFGELMSSAIGTVIVFTVIIYFGWSECSPSNKNNDLLDQVRQEEFVKDSVMARIMAEEFVKQELKTPSVAKFQRNPYPENAGGVNYMGNDTYEISSYVDSQNSFGAMLRTKYSIRVKYNSNHDTWSQIGSIVYY